MDFHTAPFEHQAEDFELTKDRLTWAYFWDPGLGKTWENINVARYQYEKGTIDALLITAPNGVHANWITDELPAHLPPGFPWEGMIWWPSVANHHWKNGVKENLREFVNQKNKLIVLATSYHAFLQDRSYNIIKQFLSERKVMWALDESDDIGNPQAMWSNRILRRAPLSVMRRINTGSPYKDGSPLPFWSQMNFLHPEILGFPKFRAFKMRYADWIIKPLPNKPYPLMMLKKKPDPVTGIWKPCYKNLDELREKVKLRATFRDKESHLKFLPKRLYNKRYVEMTPKQWEVYNRVRDDHELEFGDGFVRLIEMAMIVRLRQQQVVCGFYPKDGDEPEKRIEGATWRLDATVDETLRDPGQVIVWSRFTIDIDDLCEMFSKHVTVGRYDGKTPSAEKQRVKEAFQRRELKVLVANQRAMARGHTLVTSHRAIYHSNYMQLLPREQSEARQHRPGQLNAVLYTDIVALGTTDESNIDALVVKMEVADYLVGRPNKEWI